MRNIMDTKMLIHFILYSHHQQHNLLLNKMIQYRKLPKVRELVDMKQPHEPHPIR